MSTRIFHFSSIASITFYQYLVLHKSDNTAYAVLTIQENTPVEFSSSPLGAVAESKGDDFGDYLCDIRLWDSELYADIAHAIASEKIDIANIKFVKFNSFQIAVSSDHSNGVSSHSRGYINDNCGDMQEAQYDNMFEETVL